MVHQDAEALGRLKSEVESLEKLRHANVVSLLGEHVQEKFYALELELIEGSDLRVWQKNNKTTLIEDRLWILAQIARGLGAAHELEILHRDLKPENILISDMGEVKITDFGLARQLDRLTMTRLGLLTGSLGYMAPEVINGLKATPRSDIFSFGVIAYELLTGESPFSGETPQALLKSIVDQKEMSLKQKNPLVPARIAKLIEESLEKDPANRPETIWNLEGEILSYLSTTRLLPLCKNMMNQKTRGATLTQALSLKNKTLHSEIENLEKQNLPQIRSRLLEVAQEMMILFPEDKGSSKIIEKLNAPRSLKLPLAVILGIFILVLGGLFLWNKKEKVLEDPTPIESKVSTQINPAKVAPAKVGQIKHEPIPAHGAIKFLADYDVQIYVDDKIVPSDLWDSFKTSPGGHTVKLVKAGFLPIQNQIQVTKNKTITINARGGP